MSLWSSLRRALRRPPSFLYWRSRYELSALSEYWRAARRVRSLTETELCRRLRASSLSELWQRCASQPFPFVYPAERAQLDALCPGEFADIEAAAEAAHAHRVDLLGSGPVELGAKIDWLTDFKSGTRWPLQYWRYVTYGEPADVKVPWELSRLQWAIPLAQMYLLTKEERYAQAARDIVEQWIGANPHAWSVNWACTMEAAIRVFTLTYFFHVFHASETFADNGFRLRLLQTLFLHGDFTQRHIERSNINGNHFTTDAAALVFAGLFFGEGAAPRRWLRIGVRSLEREIRLQVFPDGVAWEGSVSYHRLLCELFLLPALYAESTGLKISPVWKERLRGMANFTAAYSANDGTSPRWGDADNGRALPMRDGALNDHRYLVGLVGSFLGDEVLLQKFSGSAAEIFWLLGPSRAEHVARSEAAPQTSQAFPNAGLFVLRHGENHVFVNCGSLAFAGRGGHAHSDLLGFEAILDGEKIVSDSGCYLYTSAVAERNAFRATASHNTAMVDSEDINRFIPGELWVLRNDAQPIVRAWEPGSDSTVLAVGHNGFARLEEPVTVERRLVLDHARGSLTIEDRFDGQGSHAIVVPLHLDPAVTVEKFEQSRAVLSSNGKIFELTWNGTNWKAAVESSRVAPSYGVVLASRQVRWTYQGNMPTTLAYSLSRLPGA